MTIEAMKQALEAMGLIGADLICEVAHHAKKDRHELGEPCPIKQRWHEAFDILRAAIEQAEKQEPVAWMHKETGLLRREISKAADWYSNYWQPLYAAPRQWVGLTDEEKRQIVLDDPIDWVAAIEAKLKEKNETS